MRMKMTVFDVVAPNDFIPLLLYLLVFTPPDQFLQSFRECIGCGSILAASLKNLVAFTVELILADAEVASKS